MRCSFKNVDGGMRRFRDDKDGLGVTVVSTVSKEVMVLVSRGINHYEVKFGYNHRRMLFMFLQRERPHFCKKPEILHLFSWLRVLQVLLM